MDAASDCGRYIVTSTGPDRYSVQTVDEAVEQVSSLLDAARIAQARRQDQSHGNGWLIPGDNHFERRAAQLERAIIAARRVAQAARCDAAG